MIAIRLAAASDAIVVAALLGQLGYEATATAAAERLGELNSTGRDPVFLACDGREILGLLALHIAPMLQYAHPAARIIALIVDARHRRRGVGRRLIEQAAAAAEAAGCELLELTSALDRTEAHAFYRRLGFDANSLRFRKVISP